jgi:hypothetical protein
LALTEIPYGKGLPCDFICMILNLFLEIQRFAPEST